ALIHAGFPFRRHGEVIGNLSGGERARLLFLVLSLNAPNFLIMDEPTNHIDIDGKEELEEQLLGAGATLLITSHDRRFLTTVASRYLWIRDGGLREISDPAEFFASPAPAATHPAVRAPAAPVPGERASAPAALDGPGEDVILARIV